jgi:hypothetical protein
MHLGLNPDRMRVRILGSTKSHARIGGPPVGLIRALARKGLSMNAISVRCSVARGTVAHIAGPIIKRQKERRRKAVLQDLTQSHDIRRTAKRFGLSKAQVERLCRKS